MVVIGAGQAGLSAAYHLQRRGIPGGFVVLDADRAPGGAWQHRWPSLPMETVNGIFGLPGMPAPEVEAREPSRMAVPRYFAAFEQRFRLPILRPVQVRAVRRADRRPDGDLMVETDHGVWFTPAIVNATGTWTNPVIPDIPGRATFRGKQWHTAQYRSLGDFAGRRVAVVGGGISAIQQLEEISRVASTFWYTRRPPEFSDEPFMPETTGRRTIAKVIADTEAGHPIRSIVSYTGLFWTPYAQAAEARGALRRRPMFRAIVSDGVIEADGGLTAVDDIVWATGFRPALAHLDPLGLQNAEGGIAMRGTRVAAEPRVHLIGFGPSQSTVGANRAGRAAVGEVARLISQQRPEPAVSPP